VVAGSEMGLVKVLVPHIICIIQTAAQQKRTHIQTQMGRCPIVRKSERPGELSLIWKYSHNSGYVTGSGNLPESIAVFGMPPCDLEAPTVPRNLLPPSSSCCFFFTLEMQVTVSSKMWRSPTRPNHHEKMELKQARNLVSIRQLKTALQYFSILTPVFTNDDGNASATRKTIVIRKALLYIHQITLLPYIF